MNPQISRRSLPLLLEATRRWLNADPHERAKGIEDAWTGLGSATDYAPAVRAGLMTVATEPNPGYRTWWKLTPQGAAIAMSWIARGLRLEHFRTGLTGQYMLAEQNGVALDDQGLAILREALPQRLRTALP